MLSIILIGFMIVLIGFIVLILATFYEMSDEKALRSLRRRERLRLAEW